MLKHVALIVCLTPTLLLAQNTVAGDWLLQWVEDGVLASAAEAGMCLPQMGLYEIADQVENA